MCNCKNTELIKKGHDRIYTLYSPKYTTNTVVSGEATGWGSTEVTFRTVKKDGTPSHKRYYVSIPWKYCPHCGDKVN